MSPEDLLDIDDVDSELPEDLAAARGDLIEEEAEAEAESEQATETAAEEVEVQEEEPEAADEDEEEGEETEEERAQREAEEEAEQKKRRIRVPKYRLDEEAERRKRAEQELEALRAQLAAKEEAPKGPSVDEKAAALEALEEQYEDAVINGEKEEARKLRAEVAKKRSELIEDQVAKRAEEARASAVEQVQFDAFVARTVEAYPALDRGHAQYDEAVEASVMELAEAFLAAGRPRIEALTKAVELVVPKAVAVEKKEAVQKAPAKKRIPAEPPKQPPAMSDRGGSGGEQPSLHTLPEEQFNKLTEEELRKARGDVL